MPMIVSERLGARTCNTLTDLTHEADHASAVQEQKKVMNMLSPEFEEAGSESCSASESNIGDRAGQPLELDNKCRGVVSEVFPVGSYALANNRQAFHPVWRR